MSVSVEIAIAATSLAATIAGYVFSTVSSKYDDKREESDASKADDIEAQCRITDIKNALNKQEFSAKWNSRSSALLKIGQYIIGGLLASNFVQETVSPQLIGGVGLLVLFSSLVSQQFQPDVKVRGNRQRAHQLKMLLRESEDWLFAIEETNKEKISEIRKYVSSNLSRIEEMELIEIESENGSSKTS